MRSSTRVPDPVTMRIMMRAESHAKQAVPCEPRAWDCSDSAITTACEPDASLVWVPPVEGLAAGSPLRLLRTWSVPRRCVSRPRNALWVRAWAWTRQTRDTPGTGDPGLHNGNQRCPELCLIHGQAGGSASTTMLAWATCPIRFRTEVVVCTCAACFAASNNTGRCQGVCGPRPHSSTPRSRR